MKINKIISGVFSLLILSSFIGCTEIEDHPDGRTVSVGYRYGIIRSTT